jgi:hypothetical protein
VVTAITDLTALIERVESGTGWDRELDGKIVRALSGSKDHWFPFSDGFMTEHTAPELTGSLDAVIRLIEAKLPGWGHCHATGWDADGRCGGFVSPGRTVDLTKAIMGQAGTPARALLSAALRAIQESRNADR